MDNPRLTLLKQTLADNDASLTRPRQIVFSLLDRPEPQTLASLAKASKGQIDRASLYRTINLFEELGIVNRINIGFKYKLELSDQFNRHHHHLTCTRCGRIINTEEPLFEELIKKLADKHRFLLSDHQLEVQGLCSECQRQ
ncbi:MAG TPA: Fur family transcriptional regulator [Candidatus Saccharimonadales bacterium]|nr:Fur family transcriptional regulator [Candidatus Saccharimonadales bacterium]